MSIIWQDSLVNKQMGSPWNKAHIEDNSNLENTNFQKI